MRFSTRLVQIVSLLLVAVITVGVPGAESAAAPAPIPHSAQSGAYPCNTGTTSGITYTYADIHRWNGEITAVATLTGVPGNVIKGIMWVESRGMLNARSPMTAYGYYFGLMQIGPTSAVPESMKSVSWMCNSAYNQILAGATELINKSVAIDSNDWTKVAGAYFGYGTDVTGTTTNAYMQMFYNHASAMSGTTPGVPDWTPPAPIPPTAIPWQNYATGTTLTVTSAKLNLRASPSTSATIVRVLNKGDKGTIIGGPTKVGSIYWYQIRLGNGVTGWVSGEHTKGTVASPTPSRTPSITPTGGTATRTPSATPTRTPTTVSLPVYRVTTRVNLRQTPSTSGTILATLATGTQVTLLGETKVANGHTWQKVRAGTRTGWISFKYLTAVPTATPSATPKPSRTPTPATTSTSTATTAASATATTPATTFALGDTVEVIDGPVNYRTAAGTSASVVGTLSSGDRGIVVSAPVSVSGVAWYELFLDGRPGGWVDGTFLRFVSAGSAPTQTALPSATATVTTVPTQTSIPPSETPVIEPSFTATTVVIIEPTEVPPPPDMDGDGIMDEADSCPTIVNSGFDTDEDTIDDACDPTPNGEPAVEPEAESTAEPV